MTDDKVPETPAGVPEIPFEGLDAVEPAAAGPASAVVPPWHELGEALDGITSFLLG